MVNSMKSLIIAFALAFGSVATADAQTGVPSPIQIVAPWARATAAGAKNGVAYMTVVNKGNSDDRLLAVSTPIAETAEPHKTASENGVMKMLPVDAVEVKAGSEVVLKPGGYHVMLMHLKAPLQQGETFPMTLTFEKAGKVDVTVKVEKAGAMGQSHSGMTM